MTEKEMLLKIIELQDQIIKLGSISPFIMDLCDHEYPQVWHGIYPPPCIKCGKLSQSIQTFIESTTSPEIIWKK